MQVFAVVVIVMFHHHRLSSTDRAFVYRLAKDIGNTRRALLILPLPPAPVERRPSLRSAVTLPFARRSAMENREHVPEHPRRPAVTTFVSRLCGTHSLPFTHLAINRAPLSSRHYARARRTCTCATSTLHHHSQTLLLGRSNAVAGTRNGREGAPRGAYGGGGDLGGKRGTRARLKSTITTAPCLSATC